MSVIVKGMEMPKEPTAIRIQIEADGTVYRHIADTNCRGWELLKNVTAIEVPPHGRLIDIDAIPMEAYRGDVYDLADALLVAPTIIEREDKT